MVPPRKRARISPSLATTSEPTASSPPKAASPTTSIETTTSLSAWTPAQETALFKLLIHHKPTGIHKHMHMLSIYNSLQSQGLTHTRPSKLQPAAPIEHMMPARIWEKLQSLYVLERLDENEEAWRLDNVEVRSEDEDEERETPPSQREEWVFGKEFAPDTLTEDPGEMADMMFARRLKDEDSPVSTPPIEERSIGTPSAKGSLRGKAGQQKGSVRSSTRQTQTASARRGSRTTTATTSTAEEEDGDTGDVAEGKDEIEKRDEMPARSTRGKTREAAKKSKGAKKKKG